MLDFLKVKAQRIVQIFKILFIIIACYSMNYFFKLSRKYCCDAIVATKCVLFESVHFDPAIKYSQC